MSVEIRSFKVGEGDKVDLDKRPTKVKDVYSSDAEYNSIRDDHAKRINRLQEMMYASERCALLIVFQGMDTAGKDGAISHVMASVDPQGCRVHSFKVPTTEELHHDFLWRAVARLPERGKIELFNRSYYEDVLVVRVHPEYLGGAGFDPAMGSKNGFWKERFESINDFELHLHRNNTRVLKFFLHISKEEQRARFLDRINQPDKNWKFGTGDLPERERWKDYMRAYEDCIGSTSKDHAPWFVVPADDKKNARLIISQAVVDAMEKMDLAYPKPDAKRAEALRAARKELEEEKLIRD